MLPDRVSNPGPLTYESGAYRLRYAARPRRGEKKERIGDGRKSKQIHPNLLQAELVGPCHTIIHVSRTPRHLKGVPAAQWVKRWPTDLAD